MVKNVDFMVHDDAEAMVNDGEFTINRWSSLQILGGPNHLKTKHIIYGQIPHATVITHTVAPHTDSWPAPPIRPLEMDEGEVLRNA